MKKLILSLLLLAGFSMPSSADISVIDKVSPKNGAFKGVVDSSQAIVDPSNFNGVLSSSDTDVQKALDTLDDAVSTDTTTYTDPHHWTSVHKSTFTGGLNSNDYTTSSDTSTDAGAWSAREGALSAKAIAEGASGEGRDTLYASSTTHTFMAYLNGQGPYYLLVTSGPVTPGNLLIVGSDNGRAVDGGTIPQPDGVGVVSIGTVTWYNYHGIVMSTGTVDILTVQTQVNLPDNTVLTSTSAFLSGIDLSAGGVVTAASANSVTVDPNSLYWDSATQTLKIKAGGTGYSSGIRVSTAVQHANMDNAGFIVVYQNFAYVTASGGDSLTTFDVSDPANPVFMDQQTGGTLVGAEGLEVAGRYLYMVSMGGHFNVYDLKNPGKPERVGYITDATNLAGAEHLRILGGYAYVINFNSGGSTPGLVAVDITSPTAPSIASTVTSSSITTPVYIQIRYPYAYITNEDASCKMTVVDISDPLNMQVVSAIVPPGCSTALYTSDFYGRYFYISSKTDQALFTLDISTPTNPVFVSSNTLAGIIDLFTIRVVGDKLYGTGGLGYAVAEFSLATPSHPTWVQEFQSIDLLHSPDDLFMVGDHMYVSIHGGTSTDGGFTILNVGAVNVPSAHIGTLTTDNAEVTHDVRAQRVFADGGIQGGTAWIQGEAAVGSVRFPNGTVMRSTSDFSGGGLSVLPDTATFKLISVDTMTVSSMTVVRLTVQYFTILGTGTWSGFILPNGDTYNFIASSVPATLGYMPIATSTSGAVVWIPAPTSGNSGLVSLSTGVTGVLPVANGGTGTATPAISAGTHIDSITGTWPNVTINAATQSNSLSGGTVGYATCWLTDSTVGHCVSSVTVTGSCTCQAAQPAPGGPAIASVHQTSVTVTWSSVSSQQGYTAEASTSNFAGGTTVSSITTNGSSTGLTIVSLSAATTYYIRVGSRWTDGTTTYVNTTPASTTTLAAGGGGSAPTFVQCSSFTYGGGGGSRAYSSTMTVTAGHLIALYAAQGGTQGNFTITSSKSDTFVPVSASVLGNGDKVQNMFYVVSAVGGDTQFFITDHTDWNNGQTGAVCEYAGANATSPLDVWSSSTTLLESGTQSVTGSTTTTATNALMFSAFYNGNGITVTSQSGTIRYQNPDDTTVMAQDAVIDSPTSYQSTMDYTSGAWHWMGMQAAFKP